MNRQEFHSHLFTMKDKPYTQEWWDSFQEVAVVWEKKPLRQIEAGIVYMAPRCVIRNLYKYMPKKV